MIEISISFEVQYYYIIHYSPAMAMYQYANIITIASLFQL